MSRVLDKPELVAPESGIEPPTAGDICSPEEWARLAELEAQGPIDHSALWAKLDEIRLAVPPEAWDDLPSDLSINLDHYLYGSPKLDSA